MKGGKLCYCLLIKREHTYSSLWRSLLVRNYIIKLICMLYAFTYSTCHYAWMILNGYLGYDRWPKVKTTILFCLTLSYSFNIISECLLLQLLIISMKMIRTLGLGITFLNAIHLKTLIAHQARFYININSIWENSVNVKKFPMLLAVNLASYWKSQA